MIIQMRHASCASDDFTLVALVACRSLGSDRVYPEALSEADDGNRRGSIWNPVPSFPAETIAKCRRRLSKCSPSTFLIDVFSIWHHHAFAAIVADYTQIKRYRERYIHSYRHSHRQPSQTAMDDRVAGGAGTERADSYDREDGTPFKRKRLTVRRFSDQVPGLVIPGDEVRLI
jgi:hypothetical protein